MKKSKYYFLFYIFVVCLVVAWSPIGFNTKLVYADIVEDVFGNVDPVIGDYVNNLIVLNFNGETDTLSQTVPENQIAIYDDVYNTNEHSLNSFYSQISNGLLNLETSFITEPYNNNIDVLSIDKDREYFMSYCFYNNSTNSWQINSDGYFGYELVESTSSPSTSSGLDFGFVLNSTHKYFVYGDSSTISRGMPSDRSVSDGIISYDYAVELCNSNPNLYLVESVERYFRELELISLISNELDGKIDLSKTDNNNDGEIDILNLNILDNPNKNYKIEWSELLWAHQFSLGSILDMQMSYGSLFTGTLHELIQNPLFANALKSMLKSHVFGDVNTYISCAQNRPSVTTNETTKNIDKYFLTTFNAQDFYGKDSFEQYKDVLEISTTAHELGHVFGLPDLYRYPSNDGDSVGYWSLMCYNSNPSQYLTAFEREQLGWLDENNIVEITESGLYDLSATIGYDDENIVAYKFQNPDDSNQWLYFEYRNKTLDENLYWEKFTGSEGLLIYRVDTSILTGNMTAEPYGLYVFRNESIYDATFGLNEEYGNFDKDILDNAITWQYGAGNYENSGYMCNVTKLNGYDLQFQFSTQENEVLVLLNGEAEKTLYVGDEYIEDGITILENGVTTEYTYDINLSNNSTYKIEYFLNNIKQDSIVCDQENIFTVVYTIKDSYGILHTLNRTVQIIKKTVETQLAGANLQVLETDTVFKDLGVVIKENGVDVTDLYDVVDFIEKLKNRTIFITYYKSDENFVVSDWTSQTIDTSENGYYVARYTIKDLYGEMHYLERHIKIVEGRKQVTGLDIKIENRLKQLTGDLILYADSLIDFDYIDLSNINISSIANLQQFKFKEGAILDLSSNKLNSFDEINVLLENTNIKILLPGNNFDINLVGYISKLNNVVIGLQNDGEYQFIINQNEVVLPLNVYNDYSNYYSLYVNNQLVENDFIINDYGVFEIALMSKENINVNDVVIIKNVCGLNQLSNNVRYRYNEEKLNNFDYDDYLQIIGIEKESLVFSNTFTSVDKNSLDNQKFEINVNFNFENIANFEYNIEIFDDVKPIIELNENVNLYFLSKEDYAGETFIDFVFCNDEFDGKINPTINKPDFDDYGKYEITFTATDLSGNTNVEKIDVYVGNVYLKDIYEFEYNTPIDLPISFDYYNIDNFIIKYKLQSQTNYTEYQKNDKILLTNYGYDVLMVQAIFYNNNSIVKSLSKEIIIVDTIAPTIKLNGEQTVYVAVGGTYMDKGVNVVDNTPDKFLIKQTQIKLNGNVVDFVDTQTENTYVFEYSVVDMGGNKSILTRMVIVGYEPIVEMAITEPSIDKIKVDKDFAISIYVFNNSNYDPNVKINWYINDVLYASGGLTQTFSFNNAGFYNIYAQVDGTTISSNILQIYVEDEIRINATYIIVTIAVLSALVVILTIWALIRKFKNRYFY